MVNYGLTMVILLLFFQDVDNQVQLNEKSQKIWLVKWRYTEVNLFFTTSYNV